MANATIEVITATMDKCKDNLVRAIEPTIAIMRAAVQTHPQMLKYIETITDCLDKVSDIESEWVQMKSAITGALVATRKAIAATLLKIRKIKSEWTNCNLVAARLVPHVLSSMSNQVHNSNPAVVIPNAHNTNPQAQRHWTSPNYQNRGRDRWDK